MKILLSSLFLGFAMMVHAHDEALLNVSVNDPNFVIVLPANPSTGYQWTVVYYDKSLLALIASNFEKEKTDRIGTGGQMHFTFALRNVNYFPENTEIQFKYAQSWEPKSATMKTIKVNFLK
ncbi:protease inhibitor I42 family protein [Legionella sp.]|uniref:protease inhibitor I42 family protein n=1 Tax=Legionella sp. TaxID=459 RepID=UPI003C9F25A8